jgi:hypothetical protein
MYDIVQGRRVDVKWIEIEIIQFLVRLKNRVNHPIEGEKKKKQVE